MKMIVYRLLFNVTTFLIFLLCTSVSSPVVAKELFGDDDDYIWKSGTNRFVKFVTIEKELATRNDHPVKLDRQTLAEALKILEYSEEKNVLRDDLTAVFSIAQINNLSRNIANGLKRAKPDQDIIFSIEGLSKRLLILTGKSFTTGRVFYKDGKLNLILGEYEYARNEALESAIDTSGNANVQYNLDYGSRKKSANSFKDYLIETAGIELKRVGSKVRRDWFVIDVDVAAETYLAVKEGKNNKEAQQDRALQLEAAKLAKERREMRLEMARMRKEMEAISQSGGSSANSIEERMATLDELKEKGLVSDDEYDAKRQEILKDI